MYELEDKKCIFFDFDGVIKESVSVKADAYEYLFSTFSEQLSQRVRAHHEINSGVSRFEKLPLYLSWAGKDPSLEMISKYSDKFSSLVVRKVIESDWVPGVLDVLRNASNRNHLFVVTATPQKEIREILKQLAIEHYFLAVIGAPTPKDDAIRSLLQKYSIQADEAIMIGDAFSDYKAAKTNCVDFILRRTVLNQRLQESLDCAMVADFTNMDLRGSN